MDIIKLRDWYRSPMGHTVRRTLQQYVNNFWPTLTGERVLVLGYGVPYAALWLKEAQVFVAMSGKMGVMHWPENKKPLTALVWENELPFSNDFFDKVFVMHSLEFSHDDKGMMGECYRVLKSKGRLLTIVPNRGGAWNRFEKSPFGRGQPYSGRQISKLLSKSGFHLTQSCYALFMPPSRLTWLQRYAPTFEKIGQRWRAPFGGVVISEAEKDVYSGTVVRVAQPQKRRQFKPAAVGAHCAKP